MHTRARCPPTGPVLPPPTNLTSLNLSNLTSSLHKLSQNETSLGWNSTTTSVSITLTSANTTFFTYHHTAPLLNSSGVKLVDDNTIFRVASVTKVFTVLAVLLSEDIGIVMEDKIGKFVEELSGYGRWKDITVGMLASQMSGAPREVNAFDYSFQAKQLVPLGFPTPEPGKIPKCGGDESQPPCSRSEFFNILLKDDLSWQPGTKAAYSDTAYILLGYALENITGKAYEEIVRGKITQPLGLNNTGFETPELGRGAIPAGMQWFDVNVGNYKSTAGLYTTPSDLSIFARAILSSTLLPAAETAAWLKPHLFTSSPYSSIGAPWEIYRPTFLSPLARPVDLYTKQGDLPGYSAYLVIIPEYEVGIVILTAGEDAFDASVGLVDSVLDEIVPVLEDRARREAEERFGGRYIGELEGNDAMIELVIDSGPGLEIKEWRNLGKDMLVAFHAILFRGKGNAHNATGLDARIYPIGVEERWRVVFEQASSGDWDGGSHNGKEKETISSVACRTWEKVDQFRYSGEPVDEFDFEVVEMGDVAGLRIPGLGIGLRKA